MKQSAGILLYRIINEEIQFFLIHPGGPFWKNKDQGAWSIPKGEFNFGEDPKQAAIREFEEETGLHIEGELIELPPVKQKSGKVVFAWGLNLDPDLSKLKSNTFPMEWPPKSGKFIDVPEADKWEWFTENQAKEKIISAQLLLIENLLVLLNSNR